MFGFKRKKRSSNTPRPATAKVATSPQKTPRANDAVERTILERYVDTQLKHASKHASKSGIGIGEEFTFFVDNTPAELIGPNEAMMRMMTCAPLYGLKLQSLQGKAARFSREG
ncbi:MAG: hypothetical protein ACTJG2_02865 [Candidatus Saccharimonadales bacterium]